jgi:hypothetical protein
MLARADRPYHRLVTSHQQPGVVAWKHTQGCARALWVCLTTDGRPLEVHTDFSKLVAVRVCPANNAQQARRLRGRAKPSPPAAAVADTPCPALMGDGSAAKAPEAWLDMDKTGALRLAGPAVGLMEDSAPGVSKGMTGSEAACGAGEAWGIWTLMREAGSILDTPGSAGDHEWARPSLLPDELAASAVSASSSSTLVSSSAAPAALKPAALPPSLHAPSLCAPDPGAPPPHASSRVTTPPTSRRPTMPLAAPSLVVPSPVAPSPVAPSLGGPSPPAPPAPSRRPTMARDGYILLEPFLSSAQIERALRYLNHHLGSADLPHDVDPSGIGSEFERELPPGIKSDLPHDVNPSGIGSEFEQGLLSGIQSDMGGGSRESGADTGGGGVGKEDTGGGDTGGGGGGRGVVKLGSGRRCMCALAQGSPLLDLLGEGERRVIERALRGGGEGVRDVGMREGDREGDGGQEGRRKGESEADAQRQGANMGQLPLPVSDSHVSPIFGGQVATSSTLEGRISPISGSQPAISPIFGCQVALRFPMPPLPSGVADGEAALPGLFTRAPLEWCACLCIHF